MSLCGWIYLSRFLVTPCAISFFKKGKSGWPHSGCKVGAVGDNKGEEGLSRFSHGGRFYSFPDLLEEVFHYCTEMDTMGS